MLDGVPTTIDVPNSRTAVTWLAEANAAFPPDTIVVFAAGNSSGNNARDQYKLSSVDRLDPAVGAPPPTSRVLCDVATCNAGGALAYRKYKSSNQMSFVASSLKMVTRLMELHTGVPVVVAAERSKLNACHAVEGPTD